MKLLCACIVFLSYSLVTGLPVKNARWVQFDDEGNKNVKSLIHDFEDLSEEMNIMEEKLKESLNANQMENKEPFEQLDESFNEEEVSDQEIQNLNRNFQNVKQQLMSESQGYNRMDKSQQFNKNNGAVKSMWDEWNGDSEDWELPATAVQEQENRFAYATQDSTPKSDDNIECKPEDLRKIAKKDLDANLLQLANKEKPDQDYEGYTVTHYITDKEGSWYCFEYEESTRVMDKLYVAVHEIKGEDHRKFEIGEDWCTCYKLVKDLKGEERPKVLANNWNDNAVVQTKSMWDEWNDDSNNDWGLPATAVQEQEDRFAYVTEDSTPKSDNKFECKPKDLADVAAKNVIDDNLRQMANREKPSEYQAYTVTHYIKNKDGSWHCFEYESGTGAMDKLYVVVHKISGVEHKKVESGRDWCTCYDLVENLKKDEKDGSNVLASNWNDDAAVQTKSMWDEWNEDGYNNQNDVASQQEQEPEEKTTSKDKACDPAELERIAHTNVQTDEIRMLSNMVAPKNGVLKAYLASPDDEWHCFLYDEGRKQYYGLVHGTQTGLEEGENWCKCYELFANFKKSDDSTTKAKSEQDYISDMAHNNNYAGEQLYDNAQQMEDSFRQDFDELPYEETGYDNQRPQTVTHQENNEYQAWNDDAYNNRRPEFVTNQGNNEYQKWDAEMKYNNRQNDQMWDQEMVYNQQGPYSDWEEQANNQWDHPGDARIPEAY